MLENHVQTVSYVISSIILVLSGDSIVKDLVIPFIKGFIKDMPSFWSIFIGTIIFILYCYFGAWVMGKFILSSNIINKENVDIIAGIGFIVLAVILNLKYHLGW